MAEKPGRPPVYQSKDEKPATVSLRIPRDLYEQAQRYVGMRRPMTLTDLLLDGLRLRLETPADPRDMILSDDNTVIRELQEMIRAAVQAEVGKLSAFMGSHFSPSGLATITEALEGHMSRPHLQQAASPAEPLGELSHDDNTVLQEVGETEQETSPTPAESKDEQTDIPPYDTSKYRLGALCDHRHDYYGTGQSLRQLVGKHECVECKNARNRAYKKRQRQAKRPA